MAYEYLEHPSEAWPVGRGATLEEAFCEGAKALFNLMTDLERVQPEVSIQVRCRSDSLETLFADWLGALLVYKDAESLVFSRFKIKQIKRQVDGFVLEGQAWGERFDPVRHESRTDVKAATYSGLAVKQTPRGYRVQCIVDI
ncbi:MAG TPA: archease [Candidatus Fraserbacteria bacterium]|nr:archease [Candidatus Fraserbacteria bacterium]